MEFARIDDLKNKLSALRPYEGDMLKQLRDYFRIGLTWSSNALEGNTLTISETKIVLEDGLTIGGRPLKDLYETVGHGEAYDFMFKLIRGRTITVNDIKTMHSMFYRLIDAKNAGNWRKRRIIVTGSEYAFPGPDELDYMVRELVGWADEERNSFHPVEFAALLHLKFVSIHPFIDGNGRVSRLMMNLALVQDGYMLAIIPPVCRVDYLNAVRKYQIGGDAGLFCRLIADRVYETEKEIMRLFHIPLK